MSVNNTETAEEFLGNAADSYGLASFSSLMDTMVEQEGAEETVEDVVSSATFGGANEGASDGVELPTAGDDYEDGSDGGEDSSTDGSEGDDGTQMEILNSLQPATEDQLLPQLGQQNLLH